MPLDHFPTVRKQLPEFSEKQIKAVLDLAADGATVPFIARYRKEKTQNLDEVAVRKIIHTQEIVEQTEKRRQFVLSEIENQGNLTDDLKDRIKKAKDLAELEEIYRPFKKKKKTKATLARDAGLQPLADWILKIAAGEIEPEETLEVHAKKFIKPAAGLVTYELALKGAQDIIVDLISNQVELREAVKKDFLDNGTLISKKTKKFKANSKYSMYADFNESVKSLFDKKNSHRYMAMRRGWQEAELQVSIEGSTQELQARFEAFVIKKPATIADDFLKTAAKLALTVYVVPSVTNEIHRLLKDNADEIAITVFSENLRKLLLSSPFGARCVLGVDPGIRTGCKVALVDSSGKYISDTVLKIQGDQAENKAEQLIGEVAEKIQIDAIAVGNGTGGREAELFLRKIVKKLGKEIPVVLVNEAGASVYSASDVAREEFPDLDLTVRGAISIARRLQDPLSELVKIDPKSIGVGQYQHDVNQPKLKRALGEVVESCVNTVGVDLNTASESLLSYVSGIGPATAKNIVKYRSEQGLFSERSELSKVERFSSKAFEQAAGFLLVPNSRMPLDATGIHPERYPAIRDMVSEIGVSLTDVVGEGAQKLVENRTRWAELLGEFTFDDIVEELKKPGRDPREDFELFQFRDDIFELKDVKAGLVCNGVVTNVTNFGAFVDIGVHQDGLVHISEMGHKFIDDTQKFVKPGERVKVKVIAVDLEKNQLALSMKLTEKPAATKVKRSKKGKSDERRASSGGGKGRPGKSNSKRRPPQKGGGRKGPPPKNPFNNPFAALADLNKK